MSDYAEATQAGMDEEPEACPCLQRGPTDYELTYVGTDPTNGRFADITLRRCRRCSRRWLHYQYEFEAFTASGAWYAGVLPPDAEVTPEGAPALLESLPWHIYGGSYFGHNGRRGTGPIL